MKKHHQFLLIIVLLAVFFVLGVGFQTRRILPSPQLRESLVQKVETLTSGTLGYQGFQVDYFPQPRLILKQTQLDFPDRTMAVEAEKICFDFNILRLLLGNAEPSAFYVLGGKSTFSIPFLSSAFPLKLENFSLTMGAFRSKIPIPLQFVSDMAGKEKALWVKGHIVVDSAEKWSWEKASGHVSVELKDLPLRRAAQEPVYDPKRSFFFKEGQVNTSVEIKKKALEPFLEFTATGAGAGMIYEVLQDKTWVTPPALNMEWNIKGAWNQDTEELKLHKAVIKVPFGSLEGNGDLKLNTGEVAGVHLTISDMALEDLLKYSPGFEKALPFHIGFSGPSKWVLSAEGTTDHLSLHLNWDFAQTLLTYGQYFSKQKDIPLSATVDCLVQNGKTLSGDFSMKFEQMVLKGSLADLDLTDGHGQLGLITNKFPITGWEKYIPVLEKYKLEGEAKLLANWKGDLRKMEKAEHIFNVTIDKGSWLTAHDQGVRNASLILDYSPLMLEGRQMKFDLGSSSLVADLKITELDTKPKIETKVTSVEIKPAEVWQVVTALLQQKADDPWKNTYENVKNSVEALFPNQHVVKDLSAEVRYAENQWDIANLQFKAYEGTTDLKGMMNFKQKEPSYRCEGEIHDLNIGFFIGRRDANQKMIHGALKLKGSLQGTGWGKAAWSKSLTGQGEFALTNGQFQSFDLKEVLATIEPFSGIGSVMSSMRDFNSLDFRWGIFEGKVTTTDLLARHPDYVIDGEGTLDFEGLANFRADLFLSSALAARIFPSMASAFQKATRAHMGPIPILLSGPLSAPQVKADPAQETNLVEKIHRKKAKELLYELVME